MEIIQQSTETKGYFAAKDNGEEVGRMTYSRLGNEKIIIDHTEVSDAYGGKGVGLKMVTAAVEFARKNNIKIIPLCPFAKGVFDKTPDFADVL